MMDDDGRSWIVMDHAGLMVVVNADMWIVRDVYRQHIDLCIL